MADSRLFQPLQVGNNTLQHRLVMAPLTRFRASDEHVPLLPLMKEYYEQRASVPGTLLITEATFISPEAGGFPNVPGIYNQDQIKAWKEITDAVHKKGSFIWVQLWALGRVADPNVLKNEGGFEVKSASPIPEAEGKTVPKEMTKEEIDAFVKNYAQAAKNAIEAGFDGVEIHGANGYLIDQFIQTNSNQRTDSYGGSIENRSRFALEVASAVVSAIGADKVGIRLSPFSDFQGMRMPDPVPQFTHVVEGLKALRLAYLHVVESRIAGNADKEPTQKVDFAVAAWGGISPVFVAGGFTAETARTAADVEYKDADIAVVFGRYFIANPDLPYRIRQGIPLHPYDRDTFYNAKSPVGYTDQPFSEEWIKENGTA